MFGVKRVIALVITFVFWPCAVLRSEPIDGGLSGPHDLPGFLEIYLANGLARVLPEGWQVKIFDHALRWWSEFVVLTQGFIETEKLIRARGLRSNDRTTLDLQDRGAAYFVYDPHDYIAMDMHETPLSFRKVEFPNPAYLLRFHKIATSMFVRHKQAAYAAYPQDVWW